MTTTYQELLAMWNDVFRKAYQAPTSTFPTLTSTISINFNGGGYPLVAGVAGAIEILFPCQIVSAHMYAGNGAEPASATASIDLQITTFNQFDIGGRMRITANNPPSMTGVVKQNVDISSWVKQIDQGDVMLYRLVNFTGGATWLSLQIGVRRLSAPIANQEVVSNTGDTVVDANGNVIQFRQ